VSRNSPRSPLGRWLESTDELDGRVSPADALSARHSHAHCPNTSDERLSASPKGADDAVEAFCGDVRRAGGIERRRLGRRQAD
jgi:hypothetical protein